MRKVESSRWNSLGPMAYGLACALWLNPFVTFSSIALGGTPSTHDRALASMLIGLATGASLRSRISPSRLMLKAAALVSAAGCLITRQIIGSVAALHPAAPPVLLILTAIPAGAVFGSITSRSRSASWLLGFATGLLLVTALEQAGLIWPMLLSAALVLDALLRREASPQIEDKASDATGARASRLTGAIGAGLLAAGLGALWVVSVRPIDLAWSTAPDTHPLMLALVAALASAAAVARRALLKLPAMSTPALLGVASIALLATLLALPRILGAGASAPPEAPPLAGLAMLLSLWVLSFGPLVATLFRASAPPGAVSVLCAGVGALATSVVLIPWLSTEGVLRTLSMAAFLSTAAALLGTFATAEGRSFGRLALSGAIAAAAFIPTFVPPWDTAALAGMSPMPPPQAQRDGQAPFRYVAEDPDGTVFVTREAPGATPSLHLGRTARFSPRDQDAEAFAGALPQLLHPQPGRALVAGTGAGLALSEARNYAKSGVTLLAPSPLRAGVLRLFSTLNGRVLEDPRLSIKIGTPRTPSDLSSGSFDTITVLSAPPGSLEGRSQYSLEGMLAVKRLLAKDGVAAIMLPTSAGPDTLTRALVTFREAFPGGLVWLCPGTDRFLLLTGSTGPLSVSYTRLERAMGTGEVTAGSLEALRSPASVLGYLLLTPEGIKAFDARLLTDFGPTPVASDPLAGAPLPRLLPALKPLASAIRDTPPGPQSVALEADLERILQRHQAYLSMLGHLDQGVYTSVIDEARKVQALATGDASQLDAFTRPYIARAQRFLEEGRPEKAIEQLTVARLIHPANVEATSMLGRIYEQKGQRDLAIQHYQEVLKVDPDSAEATLALANLYREDRRMKEAVALLEGMVSRTPGTAVLYHNLGTLYLAGDQLQKAREMFDRAVRLDGRMAAPHSGLAEVFFQQGRLDDAQQEADVAVRLDPTPYALNLQGQVAMRRGDSARARMAFVKCLLKDPEFIEARGAMGILYAEAGEIRKAEDAWKEVLKTAPDNRPAKENLERLQREYLGGGGKEGEGPERK